VEKPILMMFQDLDLSYESQPCEERDDGKRKPLEASQL
jgi:hypothetical protein